MIAAYVYQGNRLLKSYYLHSNVGLTVNDYDHSWFGSAVKCYTRGISNAQLGRYNTNAFRYVEQITSFQALVNHPQVQKLERQAASPLCEEALYDSFNRVQERREYDKADKVCARTVYFYNKQGLLLRTQYTSNRPASDRQSVREYNEQQLLTKEYLVTNQTDTSEWKQYGYDKAGHLLTATHLVAKREETESNTRPITVFDQLVLQYDEHKAIHQITNSTLTTRAADTSIEREDTPQRHITYTRNKEGFIVERKEVDYRKDTTRLTRYNYVYKGYE